MNIEDVLREMREEFADDAPVMRWADAIEAAMREPVGEVGYAWSPAPTSQAAYYGVPFVAVGGHVPPGTKLYALPPDAATEVKG